MIHLFHPTAKNFFQYAQKGTHGMYLTLAYLIQYYWRHYFFSSYTVRASH